LNVITPTIDAVLLKTVLRYKEGAEIGVLVGPIPADSVLVGVSLT
jgi:hypothetical protein